MKNTQTGSVSARSNNLALNLTALVFGASCMVCLEETLRHTTIGSELRKEAMKNHSWEQMHAADAEQSLGIGFALATVGSLAVAGTAACKKALNNL